MLNIGSRKIKQNVDNTEQVRQNRLDSLQDKIQEAENKLKMLETVIQKKSEELEKLDKNIEEQREKLSEIENENRTSLKSFLSEFYPLVQQPLPPKPDEPKCNFIVTMGTKEEQKKKKQAVKETAKLHKEWETKLVPAWEKECEQIKEYNKTISDEWNEKLIIIDKQIVKLVKAKEEAQQINDAPDVAKAAHAKAPKYPEPSGNNPDSTEQQTVVLEPNEPKQENSNLKKEKKLPKKKKETTKENGTTNPAVDYASQDANIDILEEPQELSEDTVALIGDVDFDLS